MMAGPYSNIAGDPAFPFDAAEFAVLQQNQQLQADPYAPLSPIDGAFSISATAPGAGPAAMAVPDMGFDVGVSRINVSAPGGTFHLSSGSGELPPAEVEAGTVQGRGGGGGAEGSASASGGTPSPRWNTTLDLQQELARVVKQRDEVRLTLSTLKNELYAARQVEKRLRGERDEARGQVAFLKRERATTRQTELRLRKERDQARLAAAMGKRVGKRKSQGLTIEENKGKPSREEAGNTDWMDQLEGFVGTGATARDASPGLCSPFEENFVFQFDNTKP